jgi:hypothetical protein
MPLWAGIDEAGYGPLLGPLVVAGTAFIIKQQPHEGILWELLRDAVARRARGSDGRLVVNDSKLVYSPAAGLERLEEAVLAFFRAGTGRPVRSAGDLLALLEGGRRVQEPPEPWFMATAGLSLPRETNYSAVESKASVLQEALAAAGVKMLAARAAVVFPAEFNRVVARTRNKSLLLFQKCGVILQEIWRHVTTGEGHVLVDRHGGRMRYRRLLLDVFPDCQCDVLQEDAHCSAYRVQDGARSLVVTFKEGGDGLTLPTALASMVAKYVRELHMGAFNAYWQERLNGLRPTAGYWSDAGRFLRDIAPVARAEGVDARLLVRRC